MKVLVAQSCPTLCHPIDCSLPGSSVHGIFQAIVLEWVAISFSSFGRKVNVVPVTSSIEAKIDIAVQKNTETKEWKKRQRNRDLKIW